MTSTVKINMNVCSQFTVVKATQKDDGTFDIEVTSDCPNVREFAETLENLDLTDLTDKANSRLFDRMRVTAMSANCLVPAGILHAAWIEAGLISKNLAKSVGNNNVEFVD
ncbi:MAG: hypothetical protein GKC03_05940 [Methanomassiliicoccales archaeon]|nr:hypothetical protein [Methanomassiliicoccales archaeon]NYT16069.1 hypothetical protein [Methanomassiliicoccales archaeon]